MLASAADRLAGLPEKLPKETAFLHRFLRVESVPIPTVAVAFRSPAARAVKVAYGPALS